jgi:hypothetical protein
VRKIEIKNKTEKFSKKNRENTNFIITNRENSNFKQKKREKTEKPRKTEIKNKTENLKKKPRSRLITENSEHWVGGRLGTETFGDGDGDGDGKEGDMSRIRIFAVYYMNKLCLINFY